eukprot:1484403-Rhodomonas_salina.1
MPTKVKKPQLGAEVIPLARKVVIRSTPGTRVLGTGNGRVYKDYLYKCEKTCTALRSAWKLELTNRSKWRNPKKKRRVPP